MESVDNSSNGDTHNWIPKYMPSFGFCYSYHVPEYLKVSVVEEIAFYVKEDLEIYLHHPGQFLTWQHYGIQMRAIQDAYIETMHEVIVDT